MSSDTDNTNLNIYRIYQRHYGYCQFMFVPVSHCWIGISEKMDVLSVPDAGGVPDMPKACTVNYVYPEWEAYLKVMEPRYRSAHSHTA